MKTLKSISFLVFVSASAFAQTVSIKGTVSNPKGQPIAYAFIRDTRHNYATFSDSTGSFDFKVDPASSISVLAANYQDTQLKIDGKTEVNVVLPEGVNLGKVSSIKLHQSNESSEFLRARQQLTAGQATAITNANATQHTGGNGSGGDFVVASGFRHEPTRGSIYLYADWVPGYALNKSDALVFEKEYLYNFDKVKGSIIYTNDGVSISAVSPGQLKSFTIYDRMNRPHVYEVVPEISDKRFVEVLLSTPKYKIYKFVDTKLDKANYWSNGVIETGVKYDEYVDVNQYVFMNTTAGTSQLFSLKKSALKKLFNGDATPFITSQGSRDVDDDYVKDLSESLNK
jgi:hypothetical protein